MGIFQKKFMVILKYKNYFYQLIGRSLPFCFTFFSQFFLFKEGGADQYSQFWSFVILWTIINAFFSGGVDTYYSLKLKMFSFYDILNIKFKLLFINNSIFIIFLFLNQIPTAPVLFIAIGLTAANLVELILVHWRSHNQDIHTTYPKLIQAFLLLSLIIMFAVNNFSEYAASFAMSWIACLFFAWLPLNNQSIRSTKTQRLDLHQYKEILVYGIPIAFSQVYSNSEYIALSLIDLPTIAGQYRYAWYIAFATVPIYTGISAIHLTKILNFGEKNIKNIISTSINHYVVIIALCFSEITILFIIKYFRLFEYYLDIKLNLDHIIILKISAAINLSNVVFMNILLKYHKYKLCFQISACTAIISLIYSFIFVYQLSLLGAIMSSLFTNIGMMIIFCYCIRKYIFVKEKLCL